MGLRQWLFVSSCVPWLAAAALAAGTTDPQPLAVPMAQAAKALAAGDLDAAERQLNEVLGRAPEAVAAWLALSEVSERRGDFVTALEQARRAQALSPGLPQASLAVGQLLARLGRSEEALKAFTELREQAPLEPRGYLIPALLLRDIGRREEAVSLLREAVERGLSQPEISEELSLLLLAADLPEEAFSVAAEALGEHPQRATLKLLTGLAMARLPGQRDRAIEALEGAIEMGLPNAGRARAELGTLLLEAERVDRALLHLELAAEHLPELAEAHYRLGAARRAAGDMEGARAALERYQQLGQQNDIADRQAKDFGASLNQAQLLAAENRLAEALEQIEALLVSHSSDDRVRALHAKVLFSLGQGQKALREMIEARRLAPRRVEYHFLEGLFLKRLGHPGAAEVALRRAVSLDPSLAKAHELLGILATRERPAEAVDHFERALELGTDGADLRLHYSSALGSLGREAESEEQMQAYRRLAAQ